MKKYIFYIVLAGFLLVLSPELAKADYSAKFMADGTCSIYPNSTGNCLYNTTSFNSVKKPFWLDTGDTITVITSKSPVAAPKSGSGSECPTTYSYVSIDYKDTIYYGWACTNNIVVATITDEIKEEFQAAGFPESYWEDLAILKSAHPKWTFVAIPTGLDFQTAVNNEDSGNKSLIYSNNSSSQGYLSTKDTNYNWDTDVFRSWDGSVWFAANNQTIAYYMDPRNFLSDMYIFQYESLVYYDKIQTLDVVKKVLGNSYISKFAENFMNAGIQWKVNPVYLAALSIQEVGGGTTPGAAINGSQFYYKGVPYSGYYNFYNIGATSGPSGSTERGLIYAAGLSNGSTSYGRPWNTEEKAINGGAQFMNDNYINSGQNTSYFQKWDVVYNYIIANGGTPTHKNYSHQYMQNIQAPSSEAERTYRSYFSLGLMDFDFIFYIPVYNNMPESTSLPEKGNPNNRLSSIRVNGENIRDFSSSNTNYKMTVENSVSSIKLEATTINSAATVAGTGNIPLEVGENTINLTVKAQNGGIQNYTLVITRASSDGIVYPKVAEIMEKVPYTIKENYIYNFTLSTEVNKFKEDITKVSSTATIVVSTGSNVKTSGNIQTGDTITITSGDDVITYTAVIYGDINGDGIINALDLLKVQKHILGSSPLNGAAKESADINKDSNINALDLLKVQKHILGVSNITQS